MKTENDRYLRGSRWILLKMPAKEKMWAILTAIVFLRECDRIRIAIWIYITTNSLKKSATEKENWIFILIAIRKITSELRNDTFVY